MEHNPPRAREHAAKCKLIAETAGSPTIQKTFFDLANKWVKLAEELDDARWLLNAVNELDAKAASRGIQSPVSADLPPAAKPRFLNPTLEHSLASSVQRASGDRPNQLSCRYRYRQCISSASVSS